MILDDGFCENPNRRLILDNQNGYWLVPLWFHKGLTFHYQGRDFRLTDVAGEVVKGIIA